MPRLHPLRMSLWAGVLSAALAVAPAGAQTANHGHDGHASQAASEAATPSWTDAEVRRIDREGGKLTVKHGEIKNLDMPPMTMVFQVRDKALLEPLQVGAKVQIQVIQERGQYVITALQVKP